MFYPIHHWSLSSHFLCAILVIFGLSQCWTKSIFYLTLPAHLEYSLSLLTCSAKVDNDDQWTHCNIASDNVQSIRQFYDWHCHGFTQAHIHIQYLSEKRTLRVVIVVVSPIIQCVFLLLLLLLSVTMCVHCSFLPFLWPFSLFAVSPPTLTRISGEITWWTRRMCG